MANSPWTEERIARVRFLATSKGYSAKDIADDLNCGISRNAVIGLCYRRNIEFIKARTAEAARPPRKRTPWVPKAAPAPMAKRAFDKIAEGLNEAIAIARDEAAPARLHAPEPIAAPAPRPVTVWSKVVKPPYRSTQNADDCSAFRPLGELSRFQCRWPGEKKIGDGIDTPCCAQPVGVRPDGGMSVYCQPHHARAYVAPWRHTPMTAAKEEALS